MQIWWSHLSNEDSIGRSVQLHCQVNQGECVMSSMNWMTCVSHFVPEFKLLDSRAGLKVALTILTDDTAFRNKPNLGLSQ